MPTDVVMDRPLSGFPGTPLNSLPTAPQGNGPSEPGHDADPLSTAADSTSWHLLRLSSSSDPESVDREALYGEFQPLIRRLLWQYGEDREFRADLEGELYCRFCELLEAYDPSRGIPLRPYLVRNLTLAAYTTRRRHWLRQSREVRVDATILEANSSPSGAGEHEDPSGSWDDKLMMQQLEGQITTAIQQLPQRQRQVVVLRYYQSYSFEEIAEVLRIKPATARSLLRHGIAKLRTLVRPPV